MVIRILLPTVRVFKSDDLWPFTTGQSALLAILVAAFGGYLLGWFSAYVQLNAPFRLP